MNQNGSTLFVWHDEEGFGCKYGKRRFAGLESPRLCLVRMAALFVAEKEVIIMAPEPVRVFEFVPGVTFLLGMVKRTVTQESLEADQKDLTALMCSPNPAELYRSFVMRTMKHG